ncbi:unnamed protein product [Heligmosomoides polygyrus]|uniref:Uncharacterized protein n=1 Tax=Heligmosomoides polygyrus TaxID=6339 RepID=A0A183F221_HELPZ|nr:unnamed protein product [Heligmosomoides polygyrus]
MGRKRRNGGDEAASDSAAVIRRDIDHEDEDSDESLHLPSTIYGADDDFGSKKKKEKRMSKDFSRQEEVSTSKGPLVLGNGQEKPMVKKVKSVVGGSSEFAVYLIRKPLELSLDDLNNAHIPVSSCSSKERKIAIGDKTYTVRGISPSSQMFHIPAEIIHASKNSRFKGTGSTVSGSVVISRAELSESGEVKVEDGVESLDPLELPFKVIKKKVSRKGLQNLRQRLKANGVRRTAS